MLKKQREGSKSPLFYCLHIVSKSKSWLFQKKCRACKFARGEISPSENYQISPPTPEAAALAARRRAFQATRPRLNASQLHNLGHLVHTPPTADGQRLGLYTKKAQPPGHASTPPSCTTSGTWCTLHQQPTANASAYTQRRRSHTATPQRLTAQRLNDQAHNPTTADGQRLEHYTQQRRSHTATPQRLQLHAFAYSSHTPTA